MPSRSRVGRGLVGRGHERRRVVLEPGQAPGAVQPDAAQEADLAHGGADVGGQPRARGQHQQHVARRRVEPGRHEHDRADVGGAEDRPGQRVPGGARPAGGRHRPVPALPGLAPLLRPGAAPMPVTRTSLPGGAVVAVVKRCRASRLAGAPRSSAARSTPGRQAEVSTVGSANTAEQRRARDGSTSSSADRDAEAQDPAAGGEERHVHVVEHEDLVAQHGEPVEVLGPLLVGDGRDPTPAAGPRAPRARS